MRSSDELGRELAERHPALGRLLTVLVGAAVAAACTVAIVTTWSPTAFAAGLAAGIAAQVWWYLAWSGEGRMSSRLYVILSGSGLVTVFVAFSTSGWLRTLSAAYVLPFAFTIWLGVVLAARRG